MNYLSGRYVEYTKEHNLGESENKKGILIDFYSSANEGIYGLVLLPDGGLEQVGVWEIKVQPEYKN
jgi:hypothetical protein